MRENRDFRLSKLALMVSLAMASGYAVAEDDDVVELETYTTEGQVEDAMGLMPPEPVESVFGFGKSLVETPRSATSITNETIEAYGISLPKPKTDSTGSVGIRPMLSSTWPSVV